MYFAEEGAFTGEISAPMLVALGVSHVILGHSERRQYFCETDEMVNKKLMAALKHNLVPIVCIGEHEEQKERAAWQKRFVAGRSAARSMQIDAEKLHPMVIAYEPDLGNWDGKNSYARYRRRSSSLIRSEVARLVGRPIADEMRILYGGSVKPENAEALVSQPEIDGALVGGASLDPHSFAQSSKPESLRAGTGSDDRCE